MLALQVRRKADPAKELVKEFVAKWRDSPSVMGDVTHEEMKGGDWVEGVRGEVCLPACGH